MHEKKCVPGVVRGNISHAIRPQSEVIARCVVEILPHAQVAFGGLNGGMAPPTEG